jgi:hypothetical protein
LLSTTSLNGKGIEIEVQSQHQPNQKAQGQRPAVQAQQEEVKAAPRGAPEGRTPEIGG